MSAIESGHDQGGNAGSSGWLSAAQASRVAQLGGSLVCEEMIVIPRTRPGGFDIALCRAADGVSGDFGGLLQDFSGLEEALSWAERCHREHVRLRIELAANRPYRWGMEKCLPNGGCVEIFASGRFLLLGTLLPKSVRYHSNYANAPGWHALPGESDERVHATPSHEDGKPGLVALRPMVSR